MTFLLVVLKNGVAVVTRRYATATLCCEALVKAEQYYTDLKESVFLIMKQEDGRPIYVKPVANG